MRTNNPTAWRPQQPARLQGWWRAALWIPLGYAAARTMGEGTPVLAMVCIAAALAYTHHIIPGLVELVAGGGGLLMSLSAAADGVGCGESLGEGGVGAVLVYGSIMLVSALVRLLGSGNGREMARHLLVATAALELGLVSVSPLGETVTGASQTVTLPALLFGVLLITTLIGVRSRIGFPLLGAGLVLGQIMLAATGSPCGINPVIGLAGSITFAWVALFFSRVDDEVDSASYQPRPFSRN